MKGKGVFLSLLSDDAIRTGTVEEESSPSRKCLWEAVFSVIYCSFSLSGWLSASTVKEQLTINIARSTECFESLKFLASVVCTTILSH